jgi:predicted nucleic acid-binding Zn ribbon protein
VKKPKPLSDALRAVRSEVEPETPLAALQGVWAEAVGEEIARHGRPVAERDGIVTVACDAATWAQELDLLQGELLERLRERLGEGSIERLRFVVGEGRYLDTK